MSDSLQAKGKTVVITGGATANVANVATATNTFHFLNASASEYAYVGVFKTYAAAAAMDYPGNGVDGAGLPVAPNQSITVTGDFGINPNPGNVFVSAITASGPTTVLATPITP